MADILNAGRSRMGAHETSSAEALRLNLTNDVHPIFRSENFPEANYNALLPLLRLATRLLTCKASLRHWFALCNGKRNRVPYPQGSAREGSYYFSITPLDRDLTPQETAKVKADLLQLAELTSFHRTALEPPEVLGECNTEGQPIDAKKALGPGCTTTCWRGWYARVDYSESRYQLLLRTYQDKDCIRFSAENKRILYLNLAQVFCHELAHVGYTSLKGGHVEDMVTGDRHIAEWGYDWEYAVFGGVLDVEPNSSTLTEWPCPVRIQLSQRTGGEIFVGRPLDGDIAREWSVPRCNLLQFSDDAFWGAVEREQRMRPFEFPKLMGKRLRTATCGCGTCVTGSASGARRSDKDLTVLEVGAERLELECVASYTRTVVPDLHNLDADLLEGVPEGYALLANGAMIREERLDLAMREGEDEAPRGIVGVRDEADTGRRVLTMSTGDPKHRFDIVLARS